MSVKQHHIGLGPEHLDGNSGLGRYVLLPGDRSRAAAIAGRLERVEVVDNPRGLTAHLGRLGARGDDGPLDVLVISTGMGCPSLEIVVHELLQCGARRLLRVGSCGSLAPAVQPGQVVIVTAAVRDEGTTPHYAPPEFPAVAHPDAVQSLADGAILAGLASETFVGICHSKGSLYAREFGHGPAGATNVAYQDWVARAGAIASEMEAAALFVMASAAAAAAVRPLGDPEARSAVQAGCVLAVFGSKSSHMKLDPSVARRAEERAVLVALEGLRCWAVRDRGRQARAPRRKRLP